jgi:predicted MFS family arabinose efflux permease
MTALAHIPWATKGAIAALSDSFPLWGYHKASYIIAGAVLGFLSLCALALLERPGVHVAALLLGAVHLQIASADLLCEGKFSALMRVAPPSSSAMVSFVWGNVKLGSFLGAVIIGPLADRYKTDIRFLFLVLAPLASSIGVPTALGYLKDVKVVFPGGGLK